VKRFTAHGASGAYLRVLQTGDVGGGDAVEVVHRPDHGVTAGTLFRALTTQRSRLVEVEPALDAVPHKDRDKLARRIAALVG
jgi:MOSC domain-containing protein YiiM